MLLIQNYLLQMFFSVGIIIVFGVVINALNKFFYGMLGRAGHKFCVATGFIGTPIHELSHAAMCVIFGHKVKEIKMFPSLDGRQTLGYVNHQYNTKNVYHLVGNFFIGLAPVIFGSAAIYLLMYLLTRETFFGFYDAFMANGQGAVTIRGILLAAFASIKALFYIGNLANVKWWIFIVLACSISLHLSVSPADIKSSKAGFLFVAVLLFAVDFAFYLVKESMLIAITDVILRYSIFIINFLMVSIILCLLLIVIAAVIRPLINRR